MISLQKCLRAVIKTYGSLFQIRLGLLISNFMSNSQPVGYDPAVVLDPKLILSSVTKGLNPYFNGIVT